MSIYSQRRTYPPKKDITAWVLLLREAHWEPTDVLIDIHRQLHKVFGDSPSEALIEGEQKITKEMRSYGLEHRYKDALSEMAGTVIENPVRPSLEEVSAYLKTLLVGSGSVRLFQGAMDPADIYAQIDTTIIPKSMAATLLKAINRMLPPGLKIKNAPKKAKEDFVAQVNAYDLALHTNDMAQVMVVPWPVLLATAPLTVFKENKEMPEITIQKIIRKETIVQKELGLVEKYAEGPVMVPGEEDTQGHIYTENDVRLGCHWWAENNRSFSHRHVLQGGQACNNEEIILLENYTMPADCEVNGTMVKKGTWMVGAKFCSEDLWAKVESGEIDTWSIGAKSCYIEEEVDY